MGRKTTYRLMNEIETTASTALLSKQEKQDKIIKNVKALRQYGDTKTWWYCNMLPIILREVGLTRKLTQQKFQRGRIKP